MSHCGNAGMELWVFGGFSLSHLRGWWLHVVIVPLLVTGALPTLLRAYQVPSQSLNPPRACPHPVHSSTVQSPLPTVHAFSPAVRCPLPLPTQQKTHTCTYLPSLPTTFQSRPQTQLGRNASYWYPRRRLLGHTYIHFHPLQPLASFLLYAAASTHPQHLQAAAPSVSQSRRLECQ